MPKQFNRIRIVSSLKHLPKQERSQKLLEMRKKFLEQLKVSKNGSTEWNEANSLLSELSLQFPDTQENPDSRSTEQNENDISIPLSLRESIDIDKIRSYIENRWWNKDIVRMASDSLIQSDLILVHWIRKIARDAKKTTNSEERLKLEAYSCFVNAWKINGKSEKAGFRALDTFLERKCGNSNRVTKSKRPKRAAKFSSDREKVLGAALAVCWKYKNSCNTIADLCRQIDTRSHIFFPEKEEPPQEISTMERTIREWTSKLN